MLFALWLALSGYFNALQLGLGLAACALVIGLTARMRQPGVLFLRVNWRLFQYIGWLLREIFYSNLKVAQIILDPKLPIRPVLFWAPASQRSDIGRVIFANSITLTPGTLSLDIAEQGDQILVHALHEAMAWGKVGCEMDARVRDLEKHLTDLDKHLTMEAAS